MDFSRRSFLWIMLAIGMIAALGGSALASEGYLPIASAALQGSLSPPLIERIDKGVGTIRELRLDFKSSLLGPGEADGAGIPGTADNKSLDNAPVAESPLLVIIGLGLIAVAFWGRKRLQK